MSVTQACERLSPEAKEEVLDALHAALDTALKHKQRMSWAGLMVVVTTWVALALPISLVPPKKLRARPAKRPRDGGEEAPRPGSDLPPTDLAFSSADPFEELMAPA